MLKKKFDWSIFNWLENLFGFSSLDTRSVPAESGVKFHITAKQKSEHVCILFWVDRAEGYEPLFKDGESRPDYLCLYYDGEILYLTIIEIKGKNGFEHAIDQILEFKKKFIAEISTT